MVFQKLACLLIFAFGGVWVAGGKFCWCVAISVTISRSMLISKQPGSSYLLLRRQFGERESSSLSVEWDLEAGIKLSFAKVLGTPSF